MMRRGCRVVFVHFHSYPILSRASQEKARELAKLLTTFQLRSRLLLVPFGEIQQRVVLSVRASAARRDLPPADDADRRGTGACESRPGARDRRRGRSGRVADGREPDLDQRGGDACRCSDRSSAWTRTKSPPRHSALARTRFRSSRIRTAARSSRRGIRSTRARRGDVMAAEAGLDVEEIVKQAVAAAAMEEFDFP